MPTAAPAAAPTPDPNGFPGTITVIGFARRARGSGYAHAPCARCAAAILRRCRRGPAARQNNTMPETLVNDRENIFFPP